MRVAGPRRAVSDGPANAERGASFRGFSDAGFSSRAGRDRPARVAGRAALEPRTACSTEVTSGDRRGAARGGDFEPRHAHEMGAEVAARASMSPAALRPAPDAGATHTARVPYG